MRALGSAVLAVLVLGVAWPAFAQEDPDVCQYVLVVDEAGKNVLVLDVGGDEVLGRVTLEDGDAGEFMPGGVDFTTVPGYDELFSFVTQGPFLRVVDLSVSRPRLSVDLENDLGLPEITLHRLRAAEPVVIDSQTRYPLYAVGNNGAVPWVVVFDQEALLDSPVDLNAALLGAGPILPDCTDCWGVALDIAVGGAPAAGGVQEAYASVLEWVDVDEQLRFYRLVFHEDFSFGVSLDPWNEEGVPYDGAARRVNGIDYDSTGTQPFGVFQTTSVVKDLSNGESSCELGGYPTDVAVWGPGSGMEHPDFHFVTAVTPLGSDLVLGFPAGECPDGGADFLSFPTSDVPRALALSSLTGNTPWLYSAHKNGLITALHLELSSDSEEGDHIELLESLEIPVYGGPCAVAVRDESYQQCTELRLLEPLYEPKPPKVDCDEDPDDPRCKKYDLAEPGSSDRD